MEDQWKAATGRVSRITEKAWLETHVTCHVSKQINTYAFNLSIFKGLPQKSVFLGVIPVPSHSVHVSAQHQPLGQTSSLYVCLIEYWVQIEGYCILRCWVLSLIHISKIFWFFFSKVTAHMSLSCGHLNKLYCSAITDSMRFNKSKWQILHLGQGNPGCMWRMGSKWLDTLPNKEILSGEAKSNCKRNIARKKKHLVWESWVIHWWCTCYAHVSVQSWCHWTPGCRKKVCMSSLNKTNLIKCRTNIHEHEQRRQHRTEWWVICKTGWNRVQIFSGFIKQEAD